MQRTIRTVYTAREFPSDAVGMAKRIPLEPGHWDEYDPFLLMAEDWFHAPGGFPDHPHRGIETVTLVLDGELRHADNRGNSGVLRSDDVQWMTAGGGIIHAEIPHLQSTVHSLQLWLNMPAAAKMIESSYQDLRSEDSVVAADGGARIRVISGQVEGIQTPTHNQVPVLYLDIRLDAGPRTSLPIPAAHNGFVYVLEGSGRFGAQQTSGSAGQVMWLDYPSASSGTSTLDVEAESATRFLVITGQPIREPVVAYGPFVMNTSDQIAQAYADYRAGRFGGPTPAALELASR